METLIKGPVGQTEFPHLLFDQQTNSTNIGEYSQNPASPDQAQSETNTFDPTPPRHRVESLYGAPATAIEGATNIRALQQIRDKAITQQNEFVTLTSQGQTTLNTEAIATLNRIGPVAPRLMSLIAQQKAHLPRHGGSLDEWVGSQTVALLAALPRGQQLMIDSMELRQVESEVSALYGILVKCAPHYPEDAGSVLRDAAYFQTAISTEKDADAQIELLKNTPATPVPQDTQTSPRAVIDQPTIDLAYHRYRGLLPASGGLDEPTEDGRTPNDTLERYRTLSDDGSSDDFAKRVDTINTMHMETSDDIEQGAGRYRKLKLSERIRSAMAKRRAKNKPHSDRQPETRSKLRDADQTCLLIGVMATNVAAEQPEQPKRLFRRAVGMTALFATGVVSGLIVYKAADSVHEISEFLVPDEPLYDPTTGYGLGARNARPTDIPKLPALNPTNKTSATPVKESTLTVPRYTGPDTSLERIILKRFKASLVANGGSMKTVTAAEQVSYASQALSAFEQENHVSRNQTRPKAYHAGALDRVIRTLVLKEVNEQ